MIDSLDGSSTVSRELPTAGAAPGSYAILSGTFGLLFGATLRSAAKAGRLPDHIPGGDIVLIGIAVHKVSRIIARGRVTSFIRSPFTEYEGPGHLNEVNEAPRGRGLQHALGELLACPLCIGTWVAGGFVSGWLFAPRLTRTVAATFTSVAVSDFLHLAFVWSADRAE